MKKYFIIDEVEGTIEYKMTLEDKNLYTLRNSRDSSWAPSKRDKGLYTLIDTGNGVIINNLESKESFEYDYSELSALKVLLDTYCKVDKNVMPDYKILEEV